MHPLKVYSLDRTHKTYSLSIYVTKLHFRLRHGGVPYTNEIGTRGEAPKKKYPYVRFPETGELMGDSALVIQRLIKEGKLEDVNAKLDAERRGVDWGVRGGLEGVYYLVNYERWYENYEKMRDDGPPFGHLPWGFRHVATWMAWQYIGWMLYFQGTGRHSPEEVRGFIKEAVDALEGMAGKARVEGTEPFWILGGEGPSEADFSLFGALAGYLVHETQPRTREMIRGCPALMDYLRRIQGKWFADYAGFE